MGGSFTRLFGGKIDRNILLLGHQSVGKTYLLYKLKGLSQRDIDLKSTEAFNHFQISFDAFERAIEIWDPSGKESHASLWSTYYQNVYYNCIIYVIDAREYAFDLKKKNEMIRRDKMELHTLLCEPELDDTQIILYLNWKPDEMGQAYDENLKDTIKATIPDDLEIHVSPYLERNIIVVDKMEDLQPHMLNLLYRLQPDNPTPAAAAGKEKEKK